MGERFPGGLPAPEERRPIDERGGGTREREAGRHGRLARRVASGKTVAPKVHGSRFRLGPMSAEEPRCLFWGPSSRRVREAETQGSEGAERREEGEPRGPRFGR